MEFIIEEIINIEVSGKWYHCIVDFYHLQYSQIMDERKSKKYISILTKLNFFFYRIYSSLIIVKKCTYNIKWNQIYNKESEVTDDSTRCMLSQSQLHNT